MIISSQEHYVIPATTDINCEIHNLDQKFIMYKKYITTQVLFLYS